MHLIFQLDVCIIPIIISLLYVNKNFELQNSPVIYVVNNIQNLLQLEPFDFIELNTWQTWNYFKLICVIGNVIFLFAFWRSSLVFVNVSFDW